MYKHVAKQRKLTDSNKEARLSDEDNASDDSSSDDAASDSEANDSDSAFGDDDDGDDNVVPAGGAVETDDEDAEDEIELKEPPKGFPSALEALENPIAMPEKSDEEGAEGEELQPVCVVCPSKALKHGKMLDIHLASKDHKRRLARFTAHVKAADFPASSLPFDARSICAQLDTIVFNRLSEQTLHGGPSTKAKAAAPEVPKKELSAEDQAKLAGALERQSRRAALREEKKLKNVERRSNKKEKIQRLKARKNREGAAKEGAAKEGAAKGGEESAKGGEAKEGESKKKAKASPAAKPDAAPATESPEKADAPVAKKDRKPKQKKEAAEGAKPDVAVPSPAASKKRKAVAGDKAERKPKAVSA
ncbi:hypothetical protein RQP46_003122 [Phenoliferia psychrophenolica]